MRLKPACFWNKNLFSRTLFLFSYIQTLFNLTTPDHDINIATATLPPFHHIKPAFQLFIHQT